MGNAVSRRRLAMVVVDRLQKFPRAQVLSELAAYVVEEGLTSRADLIISDIEAEFASRGHIVADVTSAFELNDASRSELAQFIAQAENAAAKRVESVELRESVDSELIGGVIIQTPGTYLDTTLKKQLNNLMNAK